jgi:hypothetical protein
MSSLILGENILYNKIDLESFRNLPLEKIWEYNRLYSEVEKYVIFSDNDPEWKIDMEILDIRKGYSKYYSDRETAKVYSSYIGALMILKEKLRVERSRQGFTFAGVLTPIVYGILKYFKVM